MISKSFKSFLAIFALSSMSVLATPPNSAVIDGQALEYDAGDLRAVFGFPVGGTPGTAPNFGADNIFTNLYVTWDTNYVYIAVNGTIGQFDSPANKMALLIDVDPGNGTGASTTTNWLAPTIDYIRYNDVGWTRSVDTSATPFGLDFMVASEGSSHNLIKVLYDGIETPTNENTRSLVDTYAGVSTPGAQLAADIKKTDISYTLNAMEARIPWSVIYGSDTGRFGTVEAGEIVPRGATLRMLANIHNNTPSSVYSSTAVIPDQTSVLAGWAAGVFTSDNYADVVIDADSNGIPDVAVGDVNAPYIKYVSGVQAKRQVFAWFNENVESNTAVATANWRVGEDIPESIALVQSDAVLLSLTNDLPAAGTLIRVESTGVEDLSTNSRVSTLYLNPAAVGIETSITVRFLLNKNSGMGFSSANPRVTTNIFLNGGVAPLEFGYPPSMSAKLTSLNSTQYYRDVTFPPGTPTDINYKYSGILDGGGQATFTNNYEAIRLANYTDAARKLILPTNGITSLVITDWLGAAAAPYRDPSTNSGYTALYTDSRRGDAGVRRRHTILFQLDLSQRNLAGVTRVILQGSDPLRGFNSDNVGTSDYAGNAYVGWEFGGIDLVDDGTLGDSNASDGIYSRLWSFTTDGLDTSTEPDAPNSLVGGSFDDVPFNGGWIDGRSPRSFKYKFWVFNGSLSNAYDSPASDIEYYIPDGSPTNIVFAPFLWDNGVLPLPPPSNAPTLISVSYSNGTGRALFENAVTELQHGFHISTNLIEGWLDYGSRATTTAVAGVWQLTATNALSNEYYRAFAGPPKPFSGVVIDPYPIPATGGNVRIYYTQHNRGLAGDRKVQIAGNWTGWNPQPMTFMGDGLWYYDLAASTSLFPNTLIKFKPRNLNGSFWDGMGGGGNDFFAYLGDLRVTYSNPHPTNGEIFTITYDAFGGPLTAATVCNAYVGFDEQWNGAGNRPMTNTVGNTNIWEVSFAVPTSTVLSINFVFNNGATWDSEGSDPPAGRQWRVFIDKP